MSDDVTAGDRGGDTPLQAWVRALAMTAPIAETPLRTLPVVIDEMADRFGDAPALIGATSCLSYRTLAQQMNRYARWAVDHGIGVGSVVSLVMANGPEYLAIWLGVARAGGTTALVNTNLVGDSLAHSLNIVAPAHVIAGTGLVDAVAAVLPQLSSAPTCWACGTAADNFNRIEPQVEQYCGEPLDRALLPLPTLRDRALCIYTSGTTGLPKAANVSHFRLMQWSHWFAGMLNTGPDDRMYNCLPMYHSIGGVVATGAVLVAGGAVVLRERFSATRFWDDVTDNGCTLFQYIGELCRYLVNAPTHPRETAHRLRLCCGNGLRGDVWETFQRRFRIPRILEFYAATEANFSLYNCDGRVGAIGKIPPFLAHRFPVVLVKVDDEAAEPARNESGFCIRCHAGETGEAICKIGSDDSGSAGRFEGYTDGTATERKILRDVFAAGDAWFRTGDLMRQDAQGFFYFVDRIGDTFRWHGENVSTSEVAAVVMACPAVVEAVAYGVTVPGAEGRAGMAALVVQDGFDLAILYRHLSERLPEYARPLFLRVRSDIAATGTFKPQKHQLTQEAYDPNVTADPIYFGNRARRVFVPLDGELYRRIQAGELRL